MGTLAKSMVVAVVAASLTAVAGAASAEIVCNADNVCWHVHRHYTYQPSFGIVVHPNNWRWGRNEHYTWKEHRGRGYWRNGVWITF